MKPRFRRLAAALACLAAATGASAQTTPPQYTELPFAYSSGRLVSASADWQVVASTTVRVQSAAWLRLLFREVVLAGDLTGASRAKLRITSHADGAVQELDANRVREWRYTSAYFNGDTLQLELLSCDPVEFSHVSLRAVWAGNLGVPQFSQCGASDDRVASNDPRLGRLMPVACTGWLIDDCMHCLLTAGHCTGGLPLINLTAIEFNVPPSLPNGAIQHPSPDDQYAIDPASFQWADGGVGDDFCYFGCFTNSNTGISPFEAQAAAFVLASSPPAFDPAYEMRVTGYGTDSTPPDASQTLQTSTGLYYAFNGTKIRYDVDTEGGNSGSPVVWEDGGGVAIGIHTHGGCTTGVPSGANWGTGTNNVALQAALAAPQGVCSPVGSVTGYCTAKLNSQGCAPVITALGMPRASGGAGSFSVSAALLLNQKSAFMFYGHAPFAAPFMGGFKCVRAPTMRTPSQSTGGTSSADDCSGVFSYDFGVLIASGLDPTLVCGAIVYAQVWSRDPADPFTVNLTSGLRFVIGS